MRRKPEHANEPWTLDSEERLVETIRHSLIGALNVTAMLDETRLLGNRTLDEERIDTVVRKLSYFRSHLRGLETELDNLLEAAGWEESKHPDDVTWNPEEATS